jgi:hypothetical protein
MTKQSELDLRRVRAAQNQSLFREVNERIEDLASSAAFSDFICECVNEACDQNVHLTVEEYEAIRGDGNRFFVVPGHEVPAVEVTVEANDRYVVVSKLSPGGEVAEGLNPRRREKLR